MDGSGRHPLLIEEKEFPVQSLTFVSLTLPLPRRRLDGCACSSPLAHFHIHHTESSVREIHPFTTITHLASEKLTTPSSTSKSVIAAARSEETIMIQFLFRKSQNYLSNSPSTNHPREERSSKQWTNKLASLVDENSLDTESAPEKAADLEGRTQECYSFKYQTSLRLEGPYFTPANPSMYHTVICLVAGTGISGAIAIASAFTVQSSLENSHTTIEGNGVSTNEHRDHQILSNNAKSWRRCVVIWSVRESDYIKLPYFNEQTPGLEVLPHLTGKGHDRLDARQTILEHCSSAPGGRTWVYISGPNAFIEGGEKACRALNVAYFGARWT